MPSLSELSEIVGFFSYSRDDDRDSEGILTNLRRRIQSELRAQIGRSEKTLRLFQDAEAIPPGSMWEMEISGALDQAVFFIPIITPRVIHSKYCQIEFDNFIARERALSRSDLVFPIIYIEVPELADERLWRNHPTLSVIGRRQYVDWTDYRYEPDSPNARRMIATFCRTIATAIRKQSAEPLAPTPEPAPPPVPTPDPASSPTLAPVPTPDPRPTPLPKPPPTPSPMPAPDSEPRLEPLLPKTGAARTKMMTLPRRLVPAAPVLTVIQGLVGAVSCMVAYDHSRGALWPVYGWLQFLTFPYSVFLFATRNTAIRAKRALTITIAGVCCFMSLVALIGSMSDSAQPAFVTISALLGALIYALWMWWAASRLPRPNKE